MNLDRRFIVAGTLLASIIFGVYVFTSGLIYALSLLLILASLALGAMWLLKIRPWPSIGRTAIGLMVAGIVLHSFSKPAPQAIASTEPSTVQADWTPDPSPSPQPAEAQEQADSDAPPAIAEKGILGSGATGTACLETKQKLHDMIDALVKNDHEGFQEAVAGGISLDEGDHVLVLERDGFMGLDMRIRLLDGPDAPQACWVEADVSHLFR